MKTIKTIMAIILSLLLLWSVVSWVEVVTSKGKVSDLNLYSVITQPSRRVILARACGNGLLEDTEGNLWSWKGELEETAIYEVHFNTMRTAKITDDRIVEVIRVED